MKTRKKIAILWCFLLVAPVAGCDTQETSASYKPENIRVLPDALRLVVGMSEQLDITVTPATDNIPALRWLSSNAAVATVTDGRVEALSPGETTITVICRDISATVHVRVVRQADGDEDGGRAVLYGESPGGTPAQALLTNGMGVYTAEGLYITGSSDVVRLDKFYALAERMVQYRVTFSADAKAVFRSSQGDFSAYVDVPAKRISIATNPVTEKTLDFLQGDREYTVEIYHVYQQAKVRIIDGQTGEEAEITAVNDGQGGVGQGALQAGFSVGMQWDHYCFGLAGGTSMLVKQITVYALKSNVKLLIYGDSVSQSEGYFPTKDFHLSWTQQIIHRLNGNAMSSGRGGGTINTVLEYIRNELPFIRTEYVMVTIGTNGGNTETNLSELVEYIQSQGAIPILNNIPCNESGTQTTVNAVIDRVRRKYNLNGCRFDLATSVKGDGQEVDKTTMYWENYTNGWGEIYHHPNEKGGRKMFERSLTDVPEIYENSE